MLKLITVLLLFLHALHVEAQSVCALVSQQVNIEDCFYRVPDYKDELNANFVVNQVLQKAGLSNNKFVVKTCEGLNNAVAIKINGLNYVFIDIKWVRSLNSGNSDWFHLAVLGHEIGHHLLGHTSHITESLSQSRQQELQADEFAGYILGNYGIPDVEINNLLNNLPSEISNNSTHPQSSNRISSYWKGVRTARLKESATWLRNVTGDTKLDLTNIPQLISLARENFYYYLKTADTSKLTKATELYKQAVRFDENEQSIYELGWLFFINQDYSKYVETLAHLYDKTHKSTYLFELAGYYSSSKDIAASQILNRHNIELRNVSTIDAMPVEVIVNYAKYRFSTMQGAVLDTGDVKIIRVALLKAAVQMKSGGDISKQYPILAQAQNTLGCIYLRLEQFEDARESFKESAAYFDLCSIGNEIVEKIYGLRSVNQLINLSNLCLTDIRLSNWNEAAYFCSEVDKKYSTASIDTKRKIDWQLNRADINYYEGRIAHNAKDYARAISCYDLAIAQTDKSYLRFYRGLSLLALARKSESCADFNKACSGGIEDACNRLQFLCK